MCLLHALLLASAAATPLCPAAPCWCVVTGASSGIGRSIAAEAARRGYAVVLAARRSAQLRQAASNLEHAHGVRTLVAAVDLGSRGGVERLRSTTASLPGTVALLIANAGFSWSGAATAQPAEAARSLLALNVEATEALVRLYGADFAAARAGAILITSSLTAFQPLPGAALYGASRAFVHSLAGGLRRELSASGVLVSCLLPGATDTEFAARSHIESSMVFTFPLGRAIGLVLSPAAVAAAALDGVARGTEDIVPGLLNRAFVLASTHLMPRGLASATAAAMFAVPSPLSSPYSLLLSLPTLVPATLCILPCVPAALAIDLVDGVSRLLRLPRGVLLALLLLLLLSVINARQNGRADHPPPPVASLEGALAIRSKADFVALWRAAQPPTATSLSATAWDGTILRLGVLAPVSAFITDRLFGLPYGRSWLGKAFDAPATGADGHSRRASPLGGNGCNRFTVRSVERFGEWRGVRFLARLAPSDLDGKPVLALDYAAAGNVVWGKVVGMRDELRELRVDGGPRVLLGVGSMAASGGMRNGAPFVLAEAREKGAPVRY